MTVRVEMEMEDHSASDHETDGHRAGAHHIPMEDHSAGGHETDGILQRCLGHFPQGPCK